MWLKTMNGTAHRRCLLRFHRQNLSRVDPVVEAVDPIKDGHDAHRMPSALLAAVAADVMGARIEAVAEVAAETKGRVTFVGSC